MTPICHITHIRNLQSIIGQGGLWCDYEAAQRNLIQQGIAHDHIKQRRMRRRVTVGPGGVLSDYVPFYFSHHSPMLYAIHKGFIADYSGGQSEVVYLVSSVECAQAHSLPFVFTDGHAEIALSCQFTDTADLTELDWTTIRSEQWADTNEDNDSKRRKQAEFLVHRFVPWECIEQIGVIDSETARGVQTLLGHLSYSPPVHVRRKWYY